jgi:hypothetical protein
VSHPIAIGFEKIEPPLCGSKASHNNLIQVETLPNECSKWYFANISLD